MAELEPVLLTLPSLTPSLALEILPRGLTIHRFYVQADGRTHDVVIGPESPKHHLEQKYTNTIVGRYANRIPVGSHIVARKGFEAEFNAQANEKPEVSLHGGPTGFDSLIWEHLTTPATLFSSSELALFPPASHAVFRLVSPDGDQGYPGTLTVEVLFALLEPGPQERKYRLPGETSEAEEYDIGSLVYVYRAKVDKGVTPVTLTQHWGFNLEASLRPDSKPVTLENHALTIKADKIVKLGPHCFHSGEYTSTSEAPKHAHQGGTIKDDYDDFYVFEERELAAPRRIPLSEFTTDSNLLKDLLTPSTVLKTKRSPIVELSSDKSGLKLEFDSNQGGVMFYSNGFAIPEKGYRKKIHGGTGDKGDGYAPRTAAFLEFHEVLTAFLDPVNEDKEDGLLTQDELYHNYVRCDVKFKEPKRSD